MSSVNPHQKYHFFLFKNQKEKKKKSRFATGAIYNMRILNSNAHYIMFSLEINALNALNLTIGPYKIRIMIVKFILNVAKQVSCFPREEIIYYFFDLSSSVFEWSGVGRKGLGCLINFIGGKFSNLLQDVSNNHLRVFLIKLPI